MTDLSHFLSAFLSDAHSWVLLSTLLFAAVAYAKGRKPLLDLLDGRTARIKSDLEEAARLKAEAQALLAESQKKYSEAEQTAQRIVYTAQDSAVRLQAEAQQKLQDTLARREAQLLDRIARAESAAVQELRVQAADIAAKAAEILLQDTLTKRGAKIVDEAIAEIPAKLN